MIANSCVRFCSRQAGRWVLVVVCVLAPSLSAAQQPGAKPPAETPAGYRITAGDALEVKFPYAADFNESTIVRPDGVIALQLVGDLKVAGLGPAEAAAMISTRYAKFLKNSEAVVIMREFATERVFLGGEVGVPGVVTLRGGLTLLQAVVSAGGPRTSARLDSVLLVRTAANNTAVVQKVNLSNVMKGREADPELRGFDLVFVPRSRIANVGLFVEHYINALIPRNLLFPYDLSTVVTVRGQGQQD